MIDVDLPDTAGVPELVRSFAACLASVTQTRPAEVPSRTPRPSMRSRDGRQ
jgi:hypothetical protein